MPHVGDILVGRYRIDAPLGAGGSAMVYRAHDLRLRRDVALKILLPNLSQDPAVAHRFEREARSLAAVNHPGIVAVYDVEAGDRRTDRDPFFVMELCDRGSLADVLIAHGGRLAPDAVVPTIADVAGGLMSLHARGFVHRDIKPHNILLTAGGAKLGDFGIARGGDSTSSLTAPGSAVGTLAYLAPELLSGGQASPASDVFALGVVVYQALTGQLPRPAGTVMEFVNAQGQPIAAPSDVRPDLGRFFDEPVAAALSGDAAARPSPLQFAGTLKAAVADWRRAGRRPDGWGRPTGSVTGAVPGSVAAHSSEDPAAGAPTSVPGPPEAGGGRRPVRLAPPDRGMPGGSARTATVRVRPARRPPPPDWLPRRRRGWAGPAIAAVMLVALVGLVAFALTDGFRLFGLGPRRHRDP
jgi:serine/threonine-protein kinase